MESLAAKHFSFADFELDGDRRLLLKQGKPVPLHSKTLDLLVALVERAGEVLSKDELLETVWAGQFVEEGNLTVHISALRKALGEKKKDHQFIATVPGRGYSFVARTHAESDIVVESHTISRILVEQETHETEPEAGQLIPVTALGQPRPDRLPGHRMLIAGGVVAAAALFFGGYAWVRSRSGTDGAPYQQMTIRKLTTNGNVSNTALSPDGKLFIYSVSEEDNESLWLGHVDGGDPLQLRPSAHLIYLALKFAPDGSSIYYTVSQDFQNGSLYKMPVFGGAPEKIRDNFRSLTFAPGGKQFAFIGSDEKTGKSIVSITNIDGTDERKIDLPSDMGSGWRSPAWSSDGSTIALAAAVKDGEGAVFLMNAADGSVKRLTTRVLSSVGAMTWVKGGAGLAAVAVDEKALSSQLWYISVPAGGVRRVTTDLGIYGFVSSSAKDSLLSVQGTNQSNVWVSADGEQASAKQITFGSSGQDAGWSGIGWAPNERIVYTADTDSGTNIWIMDADGKNQKQVIPNGGVNINPIATADGTYLIFQSNRSGHWAIWRSDLEGANMIQLTSSTAAGQPTVSCDGRWIVYEDTYDGDGQLWRMTIDGKDPVKLTDKTSEWPEISPDGKFVACGLDIDGKVKLAVLPIEGGEPAKTFDLPRLYNFRRGIHWTPDGKAIAYRDWANGIWKQSLDGEKPERLAGLPQEKLYSFGWSSDGQKFAFTRGTSMRDVVLIEDAPNR